MIENILWIAVLLMVVSSIIQSRYRIHKFTGSISWLLFSIHWFLQPLHYIQINDYFNMVLTFGIGLFCILLSYTMMKEYKTFFSAKSRISDYTDVTSMATIATALGSLFYFPFAQIPTLNEWLIATVTQQVVWILGLLGYPAQMDSWNLINFNGYTVKIILACTAIESIALFTGLIVAATAPLKKLLTAFMVSVPVIYGLNLLRNVFVVIAYTQQWFGPNSFDIAHHIIAKTGAGIVLLIIAFIVLRILPELMDLIEGLWQIINNQAQTIMDKITGNQ
ncbi:MAG: archaeosortase A [Methanohalobium sp.]|uniref:archaeosortase A n=1 Tax=Methanohalobium sp. TaxID=2837493 RepID=UPI00397E6B69